MNIMDFVDDALGRMNFIDEARSLVRFLRRGGSRRHEIQRADKGGSHSLAEVQDHLQQYGVDSVPGGFGKEHMEYTVSAKQERWAKWLVKEKGAGHVELNSPASAWSDKKQRRTHRVRRARRRR